MSRSRSSMFGFFSKKATQETQLPTLNELDADSDMLATSEFDEISLDNSNTNAITPRFEKLHALYISRTASLRSALMSIREITTRAEKAEYTVKVQEERISVLEEGESAAMATIQELTRRLRLAEERAEQAVDQIEDLKEGQKAFRNQIVHLTDELGQAQEEITRLSAWSVEGIERSPSTGSSSAASSPARVRITRADSGYEGSSRGGSPDVEDEQEMRSEILRLRKENEMLHTEVERLEQVNDEVAMLLNGEL
ncbi:hypothetical protein YB2330_000375 [Saitoella coloradoensis]